MSDEVPLGGGWSNDGVVRVADTVRRPPAHATQLMRDVLVYLEKVAFDAAPRWRGFDEQGRDTLTFIDGDTFSEPRELTDEQLAACGALLRRYHDAVAVSPLRGDSEVVSHGDYGFWNLVWRDGAPIAVIDFDNAHPGPRAEDVGYAVWKFARPEPFLAGYGVKIDVEDAVEYAKERERERFLRLGWPVEF